MSLSLVFAVAALIGGFLLLGDKSSRMWGIIAMIAAGADVAIALGLLTLSIAGLSISLLLGIVLAVAGIIALMRISSKVRVIAATIVASVGILQALAGLGIAA